jgi:hypothetical protein
MNANLAWDNKQNRVLKITVLLVIYIIHINEPKSIKITLWPRNSNDKRNLNKAQHVTAVRVTEAELYWFVIWRYNVLFSAREIAFWTGFSGFQLASTKRKPTLVKRLFIFTVWIVNAARLICAEKYVQKK